MRPAIFALVVAVALAATGQASMVAGEGDNALFYNAYRELRQCGADAINRFLRTRTETDVREDDLEGDSEDEERTLDKTSTEKAVKALSKLTKSAGLNKDDDEIVALKNRLTYLDDQNQPLLKQMKVEGWSPATLAKELHIDAKEMSMTKSQLAKDLDYQFWRQYQHFGINH